MYRRTCKSPTRLYHFCWLTSLLLFGLSLRLASTVSSVTTDIQNVSVSIASIYHQDFTTGIKSSIDLSSFNISGCGTAVLSQVNEIDFDNCGYQISSALLNVLSNSALVCRSAVQSVDYQVTYDATAAGSIVSVEATVTIIDIPYSESGYYMLLLLVTMI